MDQNTIRKLVDILGSQHVTTAREDLLCYSYDGTGREYLPAAVAFPATADEISAIMQLAVDSSFPVVPRGAGTGMSGGSLPTRGGLVLAMSRMNRILDIDTENQTALVEPGVITGEFQDEVKQHGLYYPPDPASHNFCTLGGNIAECAGGPSAVKYGVTRDYVLGLEVVLPDGRIIHTGTRTEKSVVGYDLTRLFIGSEGTLGIVTKITLRLVPLPENKATFQVLVEDLPTATGLVAKLLATHRPCTLEYMDRTALQIVSSLLPEPIPENTQAMLIIELDGDTASVTAQSEKLLDFLHGQDGLSEIRQARTSDEADSIWTARKSVSPAAFQLKPHKISEDVVVPRTKIPELVTHTEKLAQEYGLIIFTFGHAGDGNIHVNIMLDRNDPHEEQQALNAKKRLFAEVVRLSGSLSGEHGIGITKADFLPLELDRQTIAVMREIKMLFDPANILNPGKIFSLQESEKKV